MRPITYAGALTAAPSAPVTADAVNLSLRERVAVTPMRLEGTAT